jgi:hypothetical protein
MIKKFGGCDDVVTTMAAMRRARYVLIGGLDKALDDRVQTSITDAGRHVPS